MKTRKDMLVSQTLSIFALVMFALTLTVLPLIPQTTQTAHAQGHSYHSTSLNGMAALAEQELRLKEQNALETSANNDALADAAIQVDETTIKTFKTDSVKNTYQNVQERK